MENRFFAAWAFTMENVEAPTHHLALSVGHNAGLFSKIAELMNIPYAIY